MSDLEFLSKSEEHKQWTDMRRKDPLVEAAEKLQAEINKMLEADELDQRRFLEVLHDSLGVISCGVGRIT